MLQIFVCCEALAEGLKHNSTLTNLNLTNNNLGDTEAQAWCLVRMVRILRNRSWGGEVRQYGSRQSSSKVKWWNEWKEDYTEDWCWDVPSPSCRCEWIWACSFHFIGDHMICEYQRKYEKNVVELVEISCTWISKNLRWFHHVFRRSLFAVRHWQKDWSTTWLWQTWICNSTTLALKGLRLGVWWGWWGSWGIGHERRGKTV